MTDIASVSSTEIKNRRQELQNQRRFKALQAIWRFLGIAGLTGGLIWASTLPHWIVSERSQIVIEGNKLLSKDQIRQLLPLSEPQSVWQVPTQEILDLLKATPPIANAQMTRQILPPKLTIEVTERQPVAVALSAKDAGFVDDRGIFIPKSFYQQADKSWKAPSLKIVGYQEQYRQQWTQLYPLMSRSPVKILELDWRNPNNLMVKTELGTVHFGSDSKQFSQQLSVLARMRQLSGRVPLSQIIYLDLTNPDLPTLQLKQQPADKLGKSFPIRNQ
jgi:cell division protein FtsQ